MYIVYMQWIMTELKDFVIVAQTKEKAQEYIDNEMKGCKLNGTGFYAIQEIRLYK